MSSELIDQYVDKPAVSSDTDFIVDSLQKVIDQFDKLNGIKVTLQGASSLKDVSVGATDAQNSMNGLKTATQTVTDRIAQLNGSSKDFTQVLLLQTQAQKNASDANLADAKAKKIATDAVLSSAKAKITEQQASDKQAEASQKLTAEQKLLVTASLSASGSYNQLNAQLKLLTLQYKALSDAEQKSAVGKQLQVDIATTNAQLKILDAGLGNFQRNVGNYNNSLGLLAKGVKGFGGIGVILSQALGIDPSVAIAIEEVGRAIRDLQHARELQQVGLKADAELYDLNEKKIDATVAALDGDKVATIGATEANAGLATSTEAAGISQEVLATNANAAGVALESEAAAAETATVATDTLGTSLSGGLVGGAVLALAAIVALYKSITDYNSGIEAQNAAYQQLKIIIGEISSSAKAYEELRAVSAQNELKDLVQEIEVRKAAGVTALESLALDKQLATQQLATANEQAQRYNITKESLANAKSDAEAAALALSKQELEKQKLLKQTGDAQGQIDQFIVKSKLEATDKIIADYKKEADATKSFYDFANGIYEKQEEATNKIGLAAAQTLKLNADDRRALILAEATTEAEIIESKNAVILASEKSTLDQRLAALKSNQKEQLSVITATLNNTLTDPTKSDADKQIAREKANADRIKNNDSTNKAIFDVNELYRKKDLQADLDFNKTKLQADADFQSQSISDQFTAVDANVEAAKKAGDDRKEIIEDEYEFTKATQTLTDKQRLALDAAYQQKIIDNERQTNEQISQLEQKATTDYINYLQQRQKAAFDLANNKSDISTNTSETGLITDAATEEAKASSAKRILIERDLQKNLTIEDKKGQLDRLEISDEELQQELANAILIEAPTEAIEAKITENKKKEAALRKGITDDEYNYEKSVNDKKAEDARKFGQSILDLEQTIGDASFQKQQDQIQKESDLNDLKEQHDIDAVNASTQSEQDKAAAITIIQARAQAQKEELAIRAKKSDYEKAKFDKQIAILETIANIAIDISKTDYAAAALAGIALIKLIATPIPQYKHGKNVNDNYAGPAIWGDGGKSELKISNDGTMEVSPTVPTLTRVKADDIILPDYNIVEFLAANTFRSHQRFTENAKGYSPNGNNEVYKELGVKIDKMNKNIATTIRNKKEFHTRSNFNGIMSIHKHGDWWTNYVKEQTNF